MHLVLAEIIQRSFLVKFDMAFIHSITSIAHQDTFAKKNIWDTISILDETSSLVHPDYKEYIAPAALRRLSPILRMAIAASNYCQATCNSPFGAISVGTALGCLTDTEKFLKTIHTTSGSILSPTAFIQSTHNTIAGQISLELKNHAYNMTHTQNSLSFELALQDALLCVNAGKSNVLAGAADEAIDFLNRLNDSLIHAPVAFTSGATFLVVDQKSSPIELLAVDLNFSATNYKDSISKFLNQNGVLFTEMDAVFVANNADFSPQENVVNYINYTGFYHTASAFGMHMAHDWLLMEDKKYALIVNNLVADKLGLILLKKTDK